MGEGNRPRGDGVGAGGRLRLEGLARGQPCHLPAFPIPCTLRPWCSVDDSPVLLNAWSYSVKGGS